MTTSSMNFAQDELQFTQEEDFKLLRYAYDYKGNFDKSVIVLGSSRTQQEYMDRYTELQVPKISNWTEAENIKLKEYVEMYGDHKWSTIAQLLPGRNSKQCRDHYINQLAPNIRKGGWTAEEDKKILDCAKLFGNSWTKIRSQVPNRSELDIKNRYNKLIRELIDKGRILDINEIIEGVIRNPKVLENTTEAGSDYKSLSLKLEVTPELLDMQEKIKKQSSTISSAPTFPFLSRPKDTTNTEGNNEKLLKLRDPKDLIKKVVVSPHENVLVPAMNSDVAKVLAEEAERHIKLQKYSINPYDEFKIRNLRIDFDYNPYPGKSTRKYSHLSKDKYNEMFNSIEIPTPESPSTTTTSDNNNNNNNSTTDPLLPLFQSSTATSLSSFPLNPSASTVNTIFNPFSPNPVNKRRKQIETNPYTVDWYCPSCGYKNPPGSVDCKSNNCRYPNPFIDKYQQKLHLQRSEHQIQRLQQQVRQQQQLLREQGVEIEDLHIQMLQLRQKLFDRLKKTNNINKKLQQKQKQKNQNQQIQRFYRTRLSSPTDEDEEDEDFNNNNQNILQQQQQQQLYYDNNDDIIPYPYDLLQQNIENGILKPWYCPRCSNKNDLLQDQCSVCNHDNPNRYVNINGVIRNKFTLSNIEIPPNFMLEEPLPPIPSQQQTDDVIMSWICPKCGVENNNTINTCIKCNLHKPEEEQQQQIIIPDNNTTNSSSWSCVYCHHKNKNQNDICESCNNERSYAFQSIDGDDDEDDDYYYDYNNINNITNNNNNPTIESNDNQTNQMEESKSTSENENEREENISENEDENEDEITNIHNAEDQIELLKEVTDIVT